MTEFDNHILIVDDEAEILEILSDIFTAEGYICAPAAKAKNPDTAVVLLTGYGALNSAVIREFTTLPQLATADVRAGLATSDSPVQ